MFIAPHRYLPHDAVHPDPNLTKQIRDQQECGVHEAQRISLRETLLTKAREAETVEDLRPILVTLISLMPS